VLFKFLKTSFVDPLLEFINDSRAIGVVLLVNTLLSLLVTNVFPGAGFPAFWNIEFNFFHAWHLPHTLLHWINDFLMAFFFFLAGMEIKREMTEGELSSLKKSLLPVFAAIGGMVVPAIIYLLFTKGTPYNIGWGVPTATDIAFSLGIASLAGKKVPVALKIFLTALAIIDDLGAMMVIALFYGGVINIFFLLACAIITGVILLLNKRKTSFGFIHILLGLLLWYCMLNSGVHATFAGVIFAFLIPSGLLRSFEHKLHHPVYFIIMPIFALANTAIVLPAGGLGVLNERMPWGIMLGLFAGKPLGIITACFLLVKNKLAELPNETTWYHLTGAGILAGIGFTMSVFIATLAFNDTGHQDVAKIAVLTSSFFSMVCGYVWFISQKDTGRLKM
jgi:NhaA family Na+:H+ antiporter